MPTQTLGKVKLTPRGAYDPAATYVPLDIVSYGGGSYCALKNVTGVTPTGDDVNYQLLAESGADGKSPQISASKTWLVWDANKGEYVDTGVSAAGEIPEVDDTLTQPRQPADAAKVGEELRSLSDEKVSITDITLGQHTDGMIYIFVAGNPIGTGIKISGTDISISDNITVTDGVMIITALANAPVQNNAVLTIT